MWMMAGLALWMLIDGEEEAASDSAVMERMAMEVTDTPTPTAITMTRANGGCYLVRRRVMTRYGWRIRRVQVCG